MIGVGVVVGVPRQKQVRDLGGGTSKSRSSSGLREKRVQDAG